MMRFLPTLPREPHQLFFLLAMLLGISSMLLTPPFRSPDELGHYKRVVSYAHGALWEGYQLRWAYRNFFDEGNEARLANRQEAGRYDRAELLALLRVGSDEASQKITGLTGSGPTVALYAPVAYLPAIVTTALLEQIAAPAPAIAFYAMRFSLLLTSCWLIAWSIQQMPFIRWPLMLAMLWPMAAWHRGMVTADSLTIAYGCAFTALLLGQWRLRLWLITLMAFAVGLTKIVFVSYTLLLAAPDFRNKIHAGMRRWLFPLALGAFVAAAALSWNIEAKEVLQQEVDKGHLPSNPEKQIEAILHAPLHFMIPLAKTLASANFWNDAALLGSIGYLGEFDIPLSQHFCAVLLLLSAALLLVKQEIALPILPFSRLLCLGVFMGSFLLTLLALYVQWNPLGAERIEGFQGRYLLPVLPCLMYALTPRQRWQITVKHVHLCRYVTLVVLAANAYAFRELWQGFYG